jgi:hypothetical protein
MRILPIDGQRLIHLQVLAGFNTPPAEDALVWIVSVKGIGQVNGIRLWLVRNLLVFDFKKGGSVVNGAAAVVVVADRAIQEVIAQDPVKGRPLRCANTLRGGDHAHAVGGQRSASPDQFAIHLHHAGVAGLNRSKLGVVANLGYDRFQAIEHIKKPLFEVNLNLFSVYRNWHVIPTL